jgi:hypothetical protein
MNRRILWSVEVVAVWLLAPVAGVGQPVAAGDDSGEDRSGL